MMPAACAKPGSGAARVQDRVDRAPPGAVVELGEGAWSGPLVVRRPLTLRGAGVGRTVLAAGGVAVKVENARLRLEAMTIRADRRGVDATGSDVSLAGCAFEDASEAAVAVAGGSLEMEHVRVRCAAGAESSLAHAVATRDARVAARASTVDGPCAYGFDVRGGTLDLSGSQVRGSRMSAVSVSGGRAVLADLEASVVKGMRGDPFAVVFSGGGAIEARRLELAGGDIGLMVRGGQALVEDLHAAGAAAVGMAVHGGRIEARRVRLDGPFRFAAVQVSDAPEAELRWLRVRRAGPVGLSALRAPVRVTDAVVEGASLDAEGDFGHGFHVLEGSALLTDVRVDGAPGAALWASAAKVFVDGARLSAAAIGVVAANGATVKAADLKLAAGGEVGAMAMEHATVELEQSALAARVGTLSCSGGTVRLGPGVALDAERETRPCEPSDAR